MSSLNILAKKILQLDSLAGLPFNLKKLTSETLSSQMPALFIVSAGFDPSKELQEHAAQTVGKDNYK